MTAEMQNHDRATSDESICVLLLRKGAGHPVITHVRPLDGCWNATFVPLLTANKNRKIKPLLMIPLQIIYILEQKPPSSAWVQIFCNWAVTQYL